MQDFSRFQSICQPHCQGYFTSLHPNLLSPYEKKQGVESMSPQNGKPLKAVFFFSVPLRCGQFLWCVTVPWLKVRAGISLSPNPTM